MLQSQPYYHVSGSKPTSRRGHTSVSVSNQHCLDRCDSLHTVRSARPHQLDTPAMTQSYEPSRDFRMARAIDKTTSHKRCKWMPCANTRYITRNSFATREVNRAHPSQTKATQKHFSTQSSPISEKSIVFLKKLAGFACLSLLRAARR